MRKKSICLIIILLLLSGCGKRKAEPQPGSSKWKDFFCFTEEGLLYKKSEVHGKLTYLDYQNMDYGALCAKPNCLHDSMECEAFSLYQKADFIGRLGEQWYYGMTDETSGGTIRTCMLNGEQDREVGSFSHGNSYAIGTVTLFYDKYCILATADDHFDGITGAWTGTTSAIYRYDLEHGEAEVLCPEKEHEHPSYAVYGMYKDQLIYGEWIEDGMKCRQMDLKTGEIQELLENRTVINACVNENYLVGSVKGSGCSQVIEWDFSRGVQTEIMDSEIAGNYFWTPELKVFAAYEEAGEGSYQFRMYRYTEEKGCEQIRAGKSENYFMPLVKQAENLVGMGNVEGKEQLSIISYQDFLDGKNNWRMLE